MYYVYEWFIVETGEVIYVGKGTRNRYKVRKHNRFFNNMIKSFKCDSRIVKMFENEKDAFEYEYERIFELKSKGQCSCNIYNGGFGGTTSWWDNDRKEWYSKNNVMKSIKQRKRMSDNNPMKNHETARIVGEKHSKAVIVNSIEYKSVKDVMNKYGVSSETIQTWCRKGINSYGEICRYKGQEQKIYTAKRYNKGGCRELIYRDKIYESPIDLSKELGICNGTVCRWAKRGFDPEGNICRYSDDKRNLVFEKHNSGWKNKKPIIVNGIRYSSRKEAEEKLGLKSGYLAPYLSGIRKNNKYICEYDNQQPNQTNTDKSSLEGSTTNE